MNLTVADLLANLESVGAGAAALTAGIAAVFKAVQWHRAWVLDNTASKEDLARIEGKVDAVLDMLSPPPLAKANRR
jgi:hypothetical protein